MEYLSIHKKPPVGIPHMVTAFKGWPDAGEGASAAIRYLLRRLQASKAAELDAEEFYDFTQTRPQTSINREGLRTVKWPANELFYWNARKPPQGLILFLGVEPNLKWKAFSRAILDAAVGWGVKTVIHIGSLLDAVPHTRDVRVSGSSNMSELNDLLQKRDVNPSNYQGPTGITSAIMEACRERGVGYATMWAHTPHYLQAAPNYKVSYALVSRLSELLGFQVALDELRSAASTFEQEVEKAVDKDGQIGAYVRKLEQTYDEAAMLTLGDMPEPEDLVRELEQFLKERRRHDGDG